MAERRTPPASLVESGAELGEAAIDGRTILSETRRPVSASVASNTAVLAPARHQARDAESVRERRADEVGGLGAARWSVSPLLTMPARYRLSPSMDDALATGHVGSTRRDRNRRRPPASCGGADDRGQRPTPTRRRARPRRPSTHLPPSRRVEVQGRQGRWSWCASSSGWGSHSSRAGSLSASRATTAPSLPDAIERVEPVPGGRAGTQPDRACSSIWLRATPACSSSTASRSRRSTSRRSPTIRIEPGQQVTIPPGAVYEPGNATLTFIPSAGAPIEQFLDGEHEVTVRYWLLEETEQRARSYTWTFNVV